MKSQEQQESMGLQVQALVDAVKDMRDDGEVISNEQILEWFNEVLLHTSTKRDID